MEIKTVDHVTSLGSEEVIAQAVKFFMSEGWKNTSKSDRSAIFERRVLFPTGLFFLTIIGYLMCILPGLILSPITKVKARKMLHLIVNVTKISDGSEVCMQYPEEMKEVANKFIRALPSINE